MKRLILMLISLAFAACGGDIAGPIDPNAAAVGSYSLSQVNGGTLPATFFQNSVGRAEFTGGTMVLRADRSFTETRNSRIVYGNGAIGPTYAAVDNGSFAVVGAQVTFTLPASGTDAAFSYTGAFSGGVLTYTWDGVAYRYLRQ